MRVYTNGPLLRKRARRSAAYLLGATLCLLGGFFLSLLQSDLAAQYALSIASLFLGLFLWSRNQAYLHRWGVRTRQDEPLRRALRALDDRYHLLVSPAQNLPDYLLVGPMGLLVVVPSPVKGTVQCVHNHWRHSDQRPLALRWLLWFAPNPPLGNPTAEAERGVQATRSYLDHHLDGTLSKRLQVESLVVFTDPNVSLLVEGCQSLTLLLRSLRNHLRRLPRALSSSEVSNVVGALTAEF